MSIVTIVVYVIGAGAIVLGAGRVRARSQARAKLAEESDANTSRNKPDVVAWVIALVGVAISGAQLMHDLSAKDENQICTKDAPCVDIDRVADFSQSRCNSNGQKTDIAFYTDTFTLTPPADTYTARAQPEPGTKLEQLLNLDSGEPVEATSQDSGPTPTLNFVIPMKKGVARVRWTWANAHGGDVESIGFVSRYTIRNLKATLFASEDVKFSDLEFLPHEDIGNKCSFSGNVANCSRINWRGGRIKLQFKWNIWSRCASTAGADNATAQQR
jgi:hypothetical protein